MVKPDAVTPKGHPIELKTEYAERKACRQAITPSAGASDREEGARRIVRAVTGKMLKNRAGRILRESATTALKQRGFHRRGNVYVREVDGLEHVVDVQYSRWNDANDASFTLNCGVYVRGITSALSNSPEPRQPKLADCCISARVGMVKEPFIDVWWKVSATDGPARDGKIASDITSTVAGTVLPFLERFRDTKAVAEFLSGPRTEGDKHVNPLAEGVRLAYGAIVWRALGVRERCQKCIERAVEQLRNTPNGELISAFAGKFNC